MSAVPDSSARNLKILNDVFGKFAGLTAFNVVNAMAKMMFVPGFESFKGRQGAAISAVLAGRSVVKQNVLCSSSSNMGRLALVKHSPAGLQARMCSS